VSKLTPVDLSFLLLENPSRPMHMTAYQLFRPPAKQKASFVRRLLEAYRSGPVAEPFNRKVRWLSGGVASWETAEPDMDYHVRHLAVPAPGTMREFSELVSLLNRPLLDRALPLWECYVIDGIENDQFAIMIKVHHALIDGMGAMKLFDQSMSRSPRDKGFNSVWMPMERPVKRQTRGGGSGQTLLSRLGKLPADLLQIGSGFAELGAQNLRLKPATAALPFSAPRTVFNHSATSSDRRYGNCELPLAQVKALATATGSTVNDVVMTCIDHALHNYLKARGEVPDKPLVALMAMSIRSEGQGASGNQASAELVPMGHPDAELSARLEQVRASTSQIKARSAKLPPAVRQLYAMVLFGSTTLPDLAAAFKALPSINLVISNMRGPEGQRYLAGAPLTAFQGCPIVPPGAGLNVTFATVNETLCLGVGATPAAMPDPSQLTGHITTAFEQLQKTVGKKPKPRAKARRKAATARR
jgi:diacylglycerol O-acyltransferase